MRSPYPVLLAFVVVPLIVFLCIDTVSSQQAPDPRTAPAYARNPANLPRAIARVQNGDFQLVDVEIVSEAKAVEVIPALETQFGRSTSEATKLKIASALLRLGDRNEEYWTYLVERANEALNTDAPSPIAFGPDGSALQGPSPQFTNWAASHHLDVSDAFARAMFVAPSAIADMAMTGDMRSIPFLRRALTSQNHMVEVAGALGLAEVSDADSIQFIIEASSRAPRDVATEIAKALIYFDSSDAQKAVDRFVPKDSANALRADRAQGRKPFR